MEFLVGGALFMLAWTALSQLTFLVRVTLASVGTYLGLALLEGFARGLASQAAGLPLGVLAGVAGGAGVHALWEWWKRRSNPGYKPGNKT